IDAAENLNPGPFLVWSLGPDAYLLGRRDEQLVDADSLGIARLWLQCIENRERHQHGACPVRDLGNMEGKPARQQHDLDGYHRHAAPGENPIKRKQIPGEHVARGSATVAEYPLTRASHVRGVTRIADHLQRKVAFDAGTDIGGAVMQQGPAAICRLNAPEISPDLVLKSRVDGLAEIV